MYRFIKRSISTLRRDIHMKAKPTPERIEKKVTVSLTGLPNAGKSTLINAILNLPICAVSSKPHTTRHFQKTYLRVSNTEIVLIDTPGLVSEKEKTKFNLNQEFDPANLLPKLEDVNVVCIIVDAYQALQRFTKKWLWMDLLKQLSHEKKYVLILNKIDMVKKKENLLDICDLFVDSNTMELKGPKESGWHLYKFSKVFMISALFEDGIQDLVNYVLESAVQVEEKKIEHDLLSDRIMEDIVLDKVKAELLQNLPCEVPYSMNCNLEYMKQDAFGNIVISVIVACVKQRYLRMLNSRTTTIVSQECEKDLKRLFKKEVSLSIYPIFKKKVVEKMRHGSTK